MYLGVYAYGSMVYVDVSPVVYHDVSCRTYVYTDVVRACIGVYVVMYRDVDACISMFRGV